jgi:predicted amidohydrolase YtcJ
VEKTCGLLEPGNFAYLVVIDRDYLNCAEDDIRRIEPVATIVNGRVVSGRL